MIFSYVACQEVLLNNLEHLGQQFLADDQFWSGLYDSAQDPVLEVRIAAARILGQHYGQS